MDLSVELVKHLLQSIVFVHVQVPSTHPSTRLLGRERSGAGTVVDASGLILTVNYVVMGGQTIYVSAGAGRRVRAELVAQDFDVGLALLRIKRPGLHPIALGSSESVKEGDLVIALASTEPQRRQVSGGVVTYLGEFEAHWEYLLDRAIVANAPNPGLGGGALCTPRGEMVGVVSLNLNDIGRTSLSIPVEYYRSKLDELLRFGTVVSRPRRAWLGVFAHPQDEGVLVAGLVPDGPGARSGLREGDLILSVNSEQVATRRDLYLTLWRHGPGERISLEVMRDNEPRRLDVTGGDRAEFFRQI